MTVPGASLDPFTQNSEVLDRLRDRFKNAPEWRYEKGQNRVCFIFTRHNTTLLIVQLLRNFFIVLSNLGL